MFFFVKVNQKVIYVFKDVVKVVSVKSGTLKMVFLAIYQANLKSEKKRKRKIRSQ